MKKFFKDFKAFISRGNVLDLAVGMIIGGAFTAIVTAVVTNILNPILAAAGGTESIGLVTELKPAWSEIVGEETIIHDAIVIDWGAVITAVITFLFTALVLFLIIRAIAKAQEATKNAQEKIKAKHKKGEKEPEPVVQEEAAPVVAPKSTTDELLEKILAALEEKKAK